MEETRDFNLEEIRKYLKENGIDENLANSPVFIKMFSKEAEVKNQLTPGRLVVYFDKENNLITPYYREVTGHKTKGPDITIRKEGKTILIEELSRNQELVHFMMDDPIGIEENSKKDSITKVTYYLDENGESELAKETRRYSCLNAEVSEIDLYSSSAETDYEINEESLKNRNITDYPLVAMIRKIVTLEKKLENSTQENKRQRKMLEKAIAFAETVRSSGLGRLFFGKKVKEVLGEKNNNVRQLPGTSTLEER